jgi:hypothetical protein
MLPTQAISVANALTVPEFTLKFVEHPYDVPPTYGVDPYTGKSVITQDGYHVENKSIEITVKNQTYLPSYNGSSVWLVYNVQAKGHFEGSWTAIYRFDQYTGGYLPIQSSSGSAVISVPADDYPVDGEVDFQVQALTEYQAQITCYPHLGTILGAYEVTGYAIGETSDWSKTISIDLNRQWSAPDSQSSTSTSDQSGNQTTTEQITPKPDLYVVAVAAVVVIVGLVLFAAGVLLLRGRKQLSKVSP